MKALLAPFPGAPGVPAEGCACEGELAGRRVLPAVTGIGPLNAAFAAGTLLARERRSTGLVLAGVAGSLDPAGAGIGEVFAVDEEIWPEYGLFRFGALDPRGLGVAQLKDEGGAVFERLKLDPTGAARTMSLNADGLKTAASLTVAAAPGDGAAASALRRHGAPLVNMEGFAMALACRRAGAPFLEMRAVSDLAGEPGRPDFKPALDALAQAFHSLFR
jgi:futalosine hydrolase